jgi:hypothetical protein
MNPTVVFDLNQAGYQSWYFPAFGSIFWIIGFIMILINFFRSKAGLPAIKNNSGKPAPWLPYVFVGFSTLWILGTFWSTFSDYKTLNDAYKNNKCRIITGNVTNFRPGGNDRGKTDESFDIEGIHFSYSAYTVSPGFNTTSAKGGPIKEGLKIRVTEFRGDIAKLEILQY